MNKEAIEPPKLKARIFQEDGVWYAEGVDVDYLSYGDTIGEAKQNFEYGLAATLLENAKRFGSFSKILRIEYE